MLYEEANRRQASFSCYPKEHTLLSLTVALTPQRSSGSRSGGSDNGQYVAHGLALLNEMRTWSVVRQGGVPGSRIIGTYGGVVG